MLTQRSPNDPAAYQPGQRVVHPDFGEGVVVSTSPDGYVRAFFATGERQVHGGSVRVALSRTQQILAGVGRWAGAAAERLAGTLKRMPCR